MFKGCGGHFRARYGIIKSPFWPNHYPPNTKCVWTLMAPIGYRIKLIVQNFTLETVKDCKSDALTIRLAKFNFKLINLIINFFKIKKRKEEELIMIIY